MPGYQEDVKFQKDFKSNKVKYFVKMQNSFNEFYLERLKLKTKYLGESSFIRAMTDKIDSDIGMIGFILSSIKEI